MIKIYRKPGWQLNPNDTIVNAILNRIELNNGECPCVNPGETHEDRCCPCKEYRENDCCHCSLYLKKDESKD
jgi:ferredoxin-thioredoxin reductase catalytic subunit